MIHVYRANKNKKVKKSEQEVNLTLELSDEAIEAIAEAVSKEVSKRIQEYFGCKPEKGDEPDE